MVNFGQEYKNIYYKFSRINKEKPALLFLHGFSGNSCIWDDYIKALESKFNIITVDLIGHGKSESPKSIEEYLFQSQAEKIIEILEELHIESVSIVSYSFSCSIGLRVYQKINKKINAMIFISPYLKEKNNLIGEIGSRGIKFFWKYIVLNKKSSLDYSKLKNYESPKYADIRYILRCMNTKDILGSVYAYMNSKERLIPSRLEIPLLIIYGENDSMFSLKNKSFFGGFKKAEFKTLKKKKHLFLMTESSIIAKEIELFLARNDSLL